MFAIRAAADIRLVNLDDLPEVCNTLSAICRFSFKPICHPAAFGTCSKVGGVFFYLVALMIVKSKIEWRSASDRAPPAGSPSPSRGYGDWIRLRRNSVLLFGSSVLAGPTKALALPNIPGTAVGMHYIYGASLVVISYEVRVASYFLSEFCCTLRRQYERSSRGKTELGSLKNIE